MNSDSIHGGNTETSIQAIVTLNIKVHVLKYVYDYLKEC